MRSSEFEAKTAYANQLSEVDTLGSFSFETAIIYLKSLRSGDIERARAVRANFKPAMVDGKPSLMSGDQYAALEKVQTLAMHEYTHFVDATSTLWGLRHLQAMSDAYVSIEGGESQFYKAKNFFDYVRGIRLPKYYTVEYDNSPEKMPWEARPTIGRVFDSKGMLSTNPIFFSQFFNSDGKMIVRSPVSVVSILEASAMAQETLVRANLIRLTDPDYRLVEDKVMARRSLGFLYTPSVTESDGDYRIRRRAYLLAYCQVARLQSPDDTKFVGIGMDHPSKPYSGGSLDLAIFESEVWDEAAIADAKRTAQEFGLWGPGSRFGMYHATEYTYSRDAGISPSPAVGAERKKRNAQEAKKKRVKKMKSKSQKRNRS